MQYRRIEYIVKKDGTVIENVLTGTGESCLDATKSIEDTLGKVSEREFKPEYQQAENTSEEEQNVW